MLQNIPENAFALSIKTIASSLGDKETEALHQNKSMIDKYTFFFLKKLVCDFC